MDDAFIRCSRRLRLRPCHEVVGIARAAAAPLRAPMAADAAKFRYIRLRLRLTTPRSFAGTPAIAVRSKATACGITRARTAAPFGVRRTTTSRLLVAERVRVTRPIFTRRVTTRDKVETSMLVLAATST